MLDNKADYSLTLASSHANKPCLHREAKPPSSHPNLAISSTEHSLFTVKSKSRGNLIRMGIPPN